MESLHIIKGLWNLSNIGAENSDTRIKLERDSLGRVVKENNWGKRKIQKEIRMLQSEVKKNLKKGVIKCH